MMPRTALRSAKVGAVPAASLTCNFTLQHLATTDWTPSTLQGQRKLGVLRVLLEDAEQLRKFLRGLHCSLAAVFVPFSRLNPSRGLGDQSAMARRCTCVGTIDTYGHAHLASYIQFARRCLTESTPRLPTCHFNTSCL